MEHLFSNAAVRRQDRCLDWAVAEKLLRQGEYGVLSMVETRDEAPAGYGIPMSFVWDGAKCLYFHCSPEGYKQICLEACPQVSFCILGGTRLAPEKFSTSYQSVVLRGVIQGKFSDTEKQDALELIIDKYSPEHREAGLKYIKAAMARADVLRLDIDAISAKAKTIPA